MASFTLSFLLAFSSTFVLTTARDAGKRDPHPLLLTGECGRGDAGRQDAYIRGICPVPQIDFTASEPENWGPWTHKPHFADTDFAIVTDAKFRKGQGISIIDTPDRIEQIPNLLEVLRINPPSRDPNPLPFEVVPVKDKGLGVVATRAIRKEELIMIDSAALLASMELPTKMERSSGLELLSRAIHQLPDPDHYLSLAATDLSKKPEALAEDIVKTNSYNLPLNGNNYMAIFPRIPVR